MNWIIVGLGNPGKKYENTRHNAGRIVVEFVCRQLHCPEWKLDKKTQALQTKETLGKHSVKFILPETFMNNSGKSLGSSAIAKSKIPYVIVLHDDIDLPLGKFKIVYNRGSAGHRGVESVQRALHTKKFIRVRVGVVPAKKPPKKKVVDFLTGDFQQSESVVLKKTAKKIADTLAMIIEEGKEKAMNRYN